MSQITSIYDPVSISLAYILKNAYIVQIKYLLNNVNNSIVIETHFVTEIYNHFETI